MSKTREVTDDYLFDTQTIDAYGVDRYAYDFAYCSQDKGWIAWATNQDAHYFGIWVHPKTNRIFTYVEGDRRMEKFSSQCHFEDELARLAVVYGSPPPDFISYSLEGIRTEHYSDRYQGDKGNIK